MSNQASEDELIYGVDTGIPGGDNTALSIKKGSTLFTFTGDEAVAIIDLIRTEKLKLLAEVRERERSYFITDLELLEHQTGDDEIIAVPVSELTKLEAEL